MAMNLCAAWPFQLTAARRRLDINKIGLKSPKKFQLTAARRRLVTSRTSRKMKKKFQLTAARRRLVVKMTSLDDATIISTHSRAKAAG